MVKSTTGVQSTLCSKEEYMTHDGRFCCPNCISSIVVSLLQCEVMMSRPEGRPTANMV